MIARLSRVLDTLLGRGDAAVTVSPLDGPLRPNRELDEAGWRTALADVDCLAIRGDTLFASAANNLLALGADASWTIASSYALPITALAAVAGNGLAVALADGEILVNGDGPSDGPRRYRIAGEVGCITAMAALGNDLYVANGSASHAAADWQHDLLQRGSSGSVWHLDLADGKATRLAAGMAWPSGIAIDPDGLIVSEAWRHRLFRIEPQGGPALRPEPLYEDLPAYPGRLAAAADGYWLALFAPRSQLVEFVLREPAYRKRMMAEVPQPHWVAPRLRSGESFYESLQGGGVKHLGMLKPWAPTMSAGLCVKLDRSFQPRASFQSRADGRTHGVTSAVEHDGKVFVAARGDGVVVALPLPPQPDAGGTP